MVETLRNIWQALGSIPIAAGTALGNVVLGGLLVLLRAWIPPESELRNRVNLLRERLKEKVNKQLYTLISSAVKDLDPEKLRAATAARPDLIAEFTSELLRVSHVLLKLDNIEEAMKMAQTLLLRSLCAAVGSGVLMIFLPLWRPLFAAASVLTITFQLGVVFYVRRHLDRLDSYERSC